LRREANTTFVDSNEQLNIKRRTFDRFGAGKGTVTFMDVDRFSVRCFTSLYRLAAATYSKGVEAMASHPAAEHHTKAAEHHKEAAKHHELAAEHHGKGDHEKAAEHSHHAQGHHALATHHMEEAAKSHATHPTTKK